jgi:hypothetical protein
MIVQTFETEAEWLEARLGKITGSRLANIVSPVNITVKEITTELDRLEIQYDKKMVKDDLYDLLPSESKESLKVTAIEKAPKKIGFYELIAERLALPGDGENAMDRGNRLEGDALERFTKETGKKVDTVKKLWQRKDDENIAISPDGTIGKTEAVEVKCLASSRHIQALLENSIPDEYRLQAYQYFIVNDKLKKLYFVFYDPRMQCKDFFYYTIEREQVKSQVDELLEYQKRTLAEVNRLVQELSF